jgi:AraC-like DNA-binding protein
MDVLSDVLKSTRLEGAVYLNAEFTAPWCIESRYGLESVRKRLADAEHVVFFHFFVEGGCKVPLADGSVIDVHEGDLVLFPLGDPQRMGSDLRLAPDQFGAFVDEDDKDDEVIHLRHGGGGAATRVVCGYVAMSRSMSRPLFEALPPVVGIPAGDGPGASLLRELVRAGVRESSTGGPGATSLLAKLSELLFVEAMRRYAENATEPAQGWLAAVRDTHVGKALALMHAQPEHDWTVEELAHACALSRSALAERFTALLGESPIRYLARWRLALAAQALRGGNDTIARLAERSGYESEAAFTRAFKREFGVPPAQWRRARLK